MTLAACQPAAAPSPTATTVVEVVASPTTAATATVAASPTTAATETLAVTETAAVTPTEAGAGGDQGALIAVQAGTAPTLDGDATDAAWDAAPATLISTAGGANQSDTQVTVKAAYDAENVYFLLTWTDPTQSFLRSPWELQADGTWSKLVSAENQGEDENEFYEDKIALIWSIDNSIQGFETAGCFTACHAGENSDVKPYGNKYTNSPEELGDIWHWKSVRNVGQVDDQYLDSTTYSADTPAAGRKSDPNDGGGYKDNLTDDESGPAFMAPGGGDKTGAPGFITDEEKVPFDPNLFTAGDRLPAVVVAPFTGDRADLTAGWNYADGQWTLEISRPLTTGSEFDVQFDDLAGTYYFGLATFDNAQVRHAYQTSATAFTFEQ